MSIIQKIIYGYYFIASDFMSSVALRKRAVAIWFPLFTSLFAVASISVVEFIFPIKIEKIIINVIYFINVSCSVLYAYYILDRSEGVLALISHKQIKQVKLISVTFSVVAFLVLGFSLYLARQTYLSNNL